MAEKIIDIKLNAKEAIAQIKTLDDEILSLEDNVADANREMLKMEKQLISIQGTDTKSRLKRDALNKKIKETKNFVKQENVALKESNRQKTRAKKTNTELTTKLKSQAKAHNEVSKGLTKTLGGTSVLDRATGGLFSKFTGLAQGLRGATQGMKLFKIAMIGTGVGALVIAIGSLVAAFTASEEGQNKLTKALNQGKAVMANIVELASMLGNGISNTFSAIGNLITGKGGLDDVGKAIGNTFDTVSEKVSTLSEDIKEDVKVAGELSDAIAKADAIDRKLLVERQKANVKVNELRTKAYDTEKFTAQERIAFLEQAIVIEDGITNKEIEAARLRFEAKKAENEMTSIVRREDADEQFALEAKLSELQAKKVNRQREVENQRQMLVRKENQAKEKARTDAIKAETDRLDSIEDIQKDYEQRKKEREATTALQEVELEEANALAELEALNANEEAKQQVRDFALLGQIAGNNKALQVASLIGQSAAGIARTVIETQASNVATIAQGAALAIPSAGASVTAAAALVASNNIAAGIGIATNIAATAKGIQALGGKGAAPKGSVSGARGASATVPDFNVVGAAPENQLAQAIGQQEDKPLKAYVVTNEITNAQSLERNIIEGASIG